MYVCAFNCVRHATNLSLTSALDIDGHRGPEGVYAIPYTPLWLLFQFASSNVKSSLNSVKWLLLLHRLCLKFCCLFALHSMVSFSVIYSRFADCICLLVFSNYCLIFRNLMTFVSMLFFFALFLCNNFFYCVLLLRYECLSCRWGDFVIFYRNVRVIMASVHKSLKEVRLWTIKRDVMKREDL